jgi:putative ABC transport system permease protein
MSRLKGLRARLRAILGDRRSESDLQDEIAFHLDRETEKNRRLGMGEAEARRVAVAHFGGVEAVRDDHRDVRRLKWLEDFAGDARFAIRSLRRTPALAGAAIITLAVGIGANVAIFSAVNAVVLEPLPFKNPDRLVMLAEDNPEKNWHQNVAAPANYLDWRERVSAFEDAGAYAAFPTSVTLMGGEEPRLLTAARVTGSFFSTLNVRPMLGRVLTNDETWASAKRVVVLSYRAFTTTFGADTSLVGRSIRIGSADFQVVGVMPRGFAFPFEDVSLWTSINWTREQQANVSFRRAHWLRVVARLKPGVSMEQANAEFQTVVTQLQHEYPATNRVMGADMSPLHDFLVGDTRLPLLVLLAAVVLLLLIACANVGSLLLVQAAGRERESAVRLALGAGRGRLVRQAIAESLMLAVIGGALGLVFGWVGTHALEALQPAAMLRVHHFGLDGTVLGYVTLISAASGLLFSIAPAVRNGRRDPANALRGGAGGAGRTGTDTRQARRWGDALVVSEVAIALLLTVGGGLLAKSFWRLRQVNGGFDANGVLAVQISLNQKYSSPEATAAFYDQFMDRARGLPGVTDVAHASSLPLLGLSYSGDFMAAGRPADGYGSEAAHRLVSRDYFTTMRVPILRGRAFDARDRIGSDPVIIINERLARQYFPNQDPVGQRLTFDKVPTPKSQWYTIVGISGDERQASLSERSQIEILESIDQQPWGSDYVITRTTGDPAALGPSMRAILRDMDRSLVIRSSRTLTEIRDTSLARARFLTMLLLGFALVGLLLSVVGVYGLLAQLSRNRTREMGIRLALGAPEARVRWLIIRHGLGITIAGLAVGAAAALGSTRAMTALLFDTAPNDPLTLIVVALLLALTSVVASWLPARRASRADPVSALRDA